MWFNSMKGNECSIDKRTLLLHNQIKYTGDLDKCGMQILDRSVVFFRCVYYDYSSNFMELSTRKVKYCVNLFVKRSIPTECSTHMGINPFNQG